MEFKQTIQALLPDTVISQVKLLAISINNKRMSKKCHSILPFNANQYETGINLIGDIQAETGLGQSMRIIAHTLKAGGIAYNIQQFNIYRNLEQSETEWNTELKNEVRYGINIIHINPVKWAETYLKLDKNLLNGRYNIAFWLWELEEFPREWIACIDTVDEIWTPSEFISNSIRKATDKPVITVPYAIDYLTDNIYSRDYFELPTDKFLFLTMYDAISVSERKNPKAAIKAFQQAFAPKEENPGLIIKVNHLEDKNELIELKNELKDYPNVYYIDKNLTRKEVESLVSGADALISLHRAEGFGLPVAEAMYYGTPVIATNWSAVTEFTDKESACLVEYKLVHLDKNVGPYKKGSRWADADVMDAAHYMQKLYEDKEYYNQIKSNGMKKVREVLDCYKISKIIKERTEIIYEENSIC